MKVSIIIPTYNRPESLKECLVALYSQIHNKKDFEIIIVNDGGDPKEIEACLQQVCACRLRYFSISHNGPAAARNYGLRQAEADLVVFIDDDSIVTAGWAEALLKNWQKFFASDGIGGYITTGRSDTLFSRVNAEIFNWYFEQARHGEYTEFISTCNASYKKDVLVRIGGFDEGFCGAYGEDRDINIRLIKEKCKLRLVDDILVYHDRRLRFFGFVRRHFKYGQGAYQVYKKHPEVGYLSFSSYVSFYRSIINKYSGLKERILVFFLLTLSQILTVCGYTMAWLLQKGGR